MRKMHNRVTTVTDLENANVITNSGRHHAGDVFATAMLSMLKKVRVLRTEDQVLVQYAKKNGPKGLVMLGIGGEFRADKNVLIIIKRASRSTIVILQSSQLQD